MAGSLHTRRHVCRSAKHTAADGCHPGELQVHAKLGVQRIEATMRSFVRSQMPMQHRDFFTSLPFAIVAARDATGAPWVTALTGHKPRNDNGEGDGDSNSNFISSPDSQSLRFVAALQPGDPLAEAFVAGADVGMLGIELHTRRRNRANGRVQAPQRTTTPGDAGSLDFQLEIDQSFGNCPQYITERTWRWSPVDTLPPPAASSPTLSPAQQTWLRRTDTMFLASGYRGEGKAPAYGMDASHRGGKPGLVRVDSDAQISFPVRCSLQPTPRGTRPRSPRTSALRAARFVGLTSSKFKPDMCSHVCTLALLRQSPAGVRTDVQDYPGNNFFQTLGNLLMDARVGILVVDFSTGSLLHITGTATIDWAPPGAGLGAIPGAKRIVTVAISSVVERPVALPLRWADAHDDSLPLRVARRVVESDDVVSFHLEVASPRLRASTTLPPFAAGQYLPITLEGVPGESGNVHRTYSLSGSPQAAQHSACDASPPQCPMYRLSIKREPHGLISRFMHDDVKVGTVIQAGKPAGDLVLPPGAKPVVLVAGGIGVTPLVAMLHTLVDTGRAVLFAHGVRDGGVHPLAAEVRAAVDKGASKRRRGNAGMMRLHVAYSKPRAGVDAMGRDFDAFGRLNATVLDGLLREVLGIGVQGADADYVVCGPAGFMAAIVEGLVKLGTPADRVHTESFGPQGA